jgi:hypothetical protein
MVPQWPRLSLSRVYGDIREEEWVGPVLDAYNLAFNLRDYAVEVSYEPDSPIARVRARFTSPPPGVTETPLNVMQTGADEITKSIFNNPVFSSITPERRTLIEGGVDKVRSAEVVATDFIAQNTLSLLEQTAFAMLLSGNDEWRDLVHWVSRTRVVSRNYPVIFDKLSDNKIWSTAQLVAYTGSPALFQLPAGVAANDPPELALLLGWLKDPTYIEELANGNFQITERWKLARWSNHLYATL